MNAKVTSAESSSRVVLWFRELRAYSLTASVMPVLLAVGLARAFGLDFSTWMVAPILATALLLHIGTNLINDAADFRKGVDRPGTTGGSGMLTQGALDPTTVFRVGVGMMVAATLAGVPVIVVRGWPVLAMGVLGAIGGWAYTAGPAYKYKGFGDLGVFALMGPLLVLAALYALTGSVDVSIYVRALFASLPMGLLVTAILAANNYRDFDDDAQAGITTLAHLLGPRWAMRYVVGLFLLAFLVTIGLVAARQLPWSSAVALLAILPAAGVLRDLVRARDGRACGDLALVERTAKVHAVYGALVFGALMLFPA
jgi:1,4-dihydroxy-2-naphthoate octaprenyltransferase